MQASTIDEVIRQQSAIVADNKARKDPLGYFPALYRQVTLKIRDGIAQGYFDDNPRMNTFATRFANAYLLAYGQYGAHQNPSRAWKFAFDRATQGQTIILQNLLLGINAHINLDLGVVAGTMFTPAELPDFHADFDRVNDVLAALIPLARKAIEDYSPLLDELSEVGGPDAARAMEFSVDVARDEAWRTANLVALTPPALRPLLTAPLDSKAELLGRIVGDPPEPVRSVVRRIRDVESSDAVAIITALDSLV